MTQTTSLLTLPGTCEERRAQKLICLMSLSHSVFFVHTFFIIVSCFCSHFCNSVLFLFTLLPRSVFFVHTFLLLLSPVFVHTFVFIFFFVHTCVFVFFFCSHFCNSVLFLFTLLPRSVFFVHTFYYCLLFCSHFCIVFFLFFFYFFITVSSFCSYLLLLFFYSCFLFSVSECVPSCRIRFLTPNV